MINFSQKDIFMAIKEENVTFPGAATTLRCFLAQPGGSDPFPAVVVIHEAFGLNNNIKNITRRFAEQGYAALGVDLFAGRNVVICMARFFGGILFNSLDHGGIRDLKASLNYLAARPGVDKARIGAIGFCMGGSFAITWACTDNRLKAIAPYYGMNPRPQEALNRLCPVVGSYPEQDFTAKAGKTLEMTL